MSGGQRDLPRIALTPGEPAGIGPDLALALCQSPPPGAQIVLLCDPALLAQRARLLGLRLRIREYRPGDAAPAVAGEACVLPLALAARSQPGELNPANAGYVLDSLARACDGCLSGEFDALVTAPVHKGVINDAGTRFSGHTEFLAERCGGVQPVMLLVAGALRVALVTTHLPLRAVAEAITAQRIGRVARSLHRELRDKFAIERPRILVCGLNPHAGEGGHLGREEIEIIEPALAALRGEGMDLIGPLPADTLFTPRQLEGADAVLAMYHDQGLPVLKHAGFGAAVNVTLGLPIIRTSVDHGTALQLAGSGRAEVGSLRAALALAIELAQRRDGG